MLLLVGIGFAVRAAVKSSYDARRASVEASPLRQVPVYHESLDGSNYRNDDLGFGLAAPDGWATDLGTRESSRHSYDGLILRTRKEKADGAPMISLVRRTLAQNQPRDPVAYIRAVLLSVPGKVVTQEPASVEINGRPAGRVRYKIASGGSELCIEQIVFVEGAAVYTFTAVTAGDSAVVRELDAVVNSFRKCS